MYQDYRSLSIDAYIIYAFAALSLCFAAIAPLPGLTFFEHLTSGLLGGLVSASIRLYFRKIRQMDALGEADVWIILSAGFMIGPFLLGPWLLISAVVAAALMHTSTALSGRRPDPEAEENVSVMPLTPVLITTTFILLIILRTNIIPANQLPFL